MDRLVIYYSKTNHVHDIANQIEGLKIRLVPIKDIPNNIALQMLIGGYKATFDKEMPLHELEVDLNDFKEIHIISPVWAGKLSSPVSTFLKHHDLSHARVYFSLSYAGNPKYAPNQIKVLLDGNVTEIKGYIGTVFDKILEKNDV